MSYVVATCTTPDCEVRFHSDAAEYDDVDELLRQRAHLHAAHRGRGGFDVVQVWPWLWPFTIVNAAAVGLSVIVGLIPGSSPTARVRYLFPEVWGFLSWPVAAVVVVAGVLLYAVVATRRRPAGTDAPWRFYAELTRAWFAVTVGCFAAGFAAGQLLP